MAVTRAIRGVASSVCLVAILSTLVALPGPRADRPPAAGALQLMEDPITSDAAERYARVVRIRPPGSEEGIDLPVWKETRNRSPGAMVAPWSMIAALQDSPALPVVFRASTEEPPHLVVWLWDQWPSSHYLAFNFERLGLSEQGWDSLERWGLPRNGAPEGRTICHSWSERTPELRVADFLLIDAPQSENSIGCLAAGLLRHLGNPLGRLVFREFDGMNQEAMPNVRHLYRCAVGSQFNFVRSNPPTAQSHRDKVDYLSRLDQQARRDCVPGT